MEQFIVIQTTKKFPSAMEPESSSTCSQNPTNGTHPEAVQSSLHIHNLFGKDKLNIILVCTYLNR
jgi:hypothetical protein